VTVLWGTRIIPVSTVMRWFYPKTDQIGMTSLTPTADVLVAAGRYWQRHCHEAEVGLLIGDLVDRLESLLSDIDDLEIELHGEPPQNPEWDE